MNIATAPQAPDEDAATLDRLIDEATKRKKLQAYIRTLPREVQLFIEECRVADNTLKAENPPLGYEAFPVRDLPLAESYLTRCVGLRCHGHVCTAGVAAGDEGEAVDKGA